MATKPKDVDPVVTAEIVAVIVTAKQDRRWRAGRCFTPEPVRVALADLTEAQLMALHGDPVLVVQTETA